MRVFSARFTLGLLLVGTVCATADTAQAFGRRRGGNACCSSGTYGGYGGYSGYGGYGNYYGGTGYGGYGNYYSTSMYGNTYGAYQSSGCCGGAVMNTQGYAQPGMVNPAAYINPAGVPNALPARTNETKVRITDGTYEPATVNITAGSTVRWTNDGRQPHTVTSSKGDWGSADITPGQDFTATFTQPGTFEYYCKFHKDMKGTIVVK